MRHNAAKHYRKAQTAPRADAQPPQVAQTRQAVKQWRRRLRLLFRDLGMPLTPWQLQYAATLLAAKKGTTVTQPTGPTPNVEQRRLMRDIAADRVYAAADGSVRARAELGHRKVRRSLLDSVAETHGWAFLGTGDRYRLSKAGREALDAADLRQR